MSGPVPNVSDTRLMPGPEHAASALMEETRSELAE